ncbi:ABC-F family ATP-binding cassette domain-containing protein [Desulfosarcina ovata]|uniref:ABC transporter ATP-binding protein n=1 Tax=Desulfosarcina ovata subsp. ovata TaxID=2752305 RepID=A0A5K8AFL1_9BACT|nr:ABC-F family ATP-binding cassette domain-containing protein [Desulfosarcina ovata]BBO91397.1 ABC transporter ATP-binding protein [Desulfosarcina ovata subsp. ovata]
MISIENLSKSYGDRVLFDGVSFKINSKERVGLVGRNGHGKSTLFRIIVGEEGYDDGAITMPKGYRIGYVQQLIQFTEATVLAEGMKGLMPAEKDHHWKVEKILAGLGFSDGDLVRSPHDFSGGFQVRLNLAKVLVSEPDLLLLDEPTNYLDITSIRWIENFLLSWPHELMLITHDRGFMDKLVTHTVGLHRRKARKIAGNTEKFYEQIAQDEEIYEKTRLNDERREKEIRLFISRFRAKARLANMVQSRVKTLAKMEKRDKLEEVKSLEFSFRSKPFRAKQVFSVESLAFAWGAGRPLFEDLSFSILAGERICVVGKNGKGKTTLLKVLAGTLDPLAGTITYNPQVESGLFEQTNIQRLVDNRTVEEEILYAQPDVDRQKARNICGAMMFEGDSALKKIGVLSGGEKSRVMLGQLLVTPVNLLMLDEPTNHLDMDACDALLAAIDAFDGAVIMVTHNEMFLHALADRLIVFDDLGAHMFDGTYQDFLEKGGWGDDVSITRRRDDPDAGEPAAAPRFTKKELRRLRSEVITEKSKVLKPMEETIAAAEREIEANETRLEQFNQEMVDASQAGDGAQIASLSQKIRSCQEIIETRFAEMEAADEQRQRLEKKFAKRLAELEG